MAPALVSLLLLLPLQNHPASGADPARCRVVLDDLGNVGLRIADAQGLATDVMTGLRARMGEDAVVFEGTLTGQLKMKKMLGPGAEAQVQEEQIAYLRAALKSAPFRVKVRFGKKKKRHFIELSCRNAEGSKALERERFEATTLAEARKQMNAALPDFCRLMDPAEKGAEEPAQKPKKEWALPPRRD